MSSTLRNVPAVRCVHRHGLTALQRVILISCLIHLRRGGTGGVADNVVDGAHGLADERHRAGGEQLHGLPVLHEGAARAPQRAAKRLERVGGGLKYTSLKMMLMIKIMSLEKRLFVFSFCVKDRTGKMLYICNTLYATYKENVRLAAQTSKHQTYKIKNSRIPSVRPASGGTCRWRRSTAAGRRWRPESRRR